MDAKNRWFKRTRFAWVLGLAIAGLLLVVGLYAWSKYRVDADRPAPELSYLAKRVSVPRADPLEVVTYTIYISNTGALVNTPISLTDQVPNGLAYVPGSLVGSHGKVDDSANPTLTWQGNLKTSALITITYQASVTGVVTGSIVNQATLQISPDTSIPLAASLTVPAGVLATTMEDFYVPGTQPGGLATDIHPAADCDACHSHPIYDSWRGSMMSQAARDPLLWAALSVANVDAPESGEYCLRCHTLRGWLQGRSQPADGSALLQQDIHDGVSCATCHRMVDPVANPGDETAAIDATIRSELGDDAPPAGLVGSAAVIVDPNDNRRGPFSFSPALPYHIAYRSAFFGQDQDAVTHARMCGSCHNVYNPALSWDEARQQFWPNELESHAPSFAQDQLFPVETTFEEWLASDFANGGAVVPFIKTHKVDGVVENCQDCHMPRVVGTAADPAFNPVTRDRPATGWLPTHTFVSGNTWAPQLLQNTSWRLNTAGESDYLKATVLEAQAMLQRAASLQVTLAENGPNKTATVRLTNETGHKLPTGYSEGRRMWLNLQAFDGNGNLVYQSGAYDPLTGELLRDADIKIYEVLQGMTPELAEVVKLPAGESFHFVLNNTVVKDNRIPPRGVTQAEFNRPGLRPVEAVYLDGQYWDDTTYTLPPEAVRVEAYLYYQTSSKEYIDFLRLYGGVDGLALGLLWDGLKSPPQLMAVAFYPAQSAYSLIVNQ